MSYETYRVTDLIDEIAMGPFGSNIKVSCFVDSGVPVLNGSNLEGFSLSEKAFRFVTKEKADSLNKANAHRGDIVITHRGTLGQIVFIPQDSRYDRYVISQSQFRVRCNDKVLPEYLVYYFHTPIGQHKLLSNASQVGVPALARPSSTFQQIEVELPELSIQKRVVEIITTIQKKIENNQELNDNLYAQAKAIFDNHFINIDAIPARWRKGNLLDIANYLNGLAMQKFRPQGNEIGLPVLKIKELRQGSCDDSSELCSLSIKPEYIIHDGDVVFSWSGSLLVDIWCGGTCGLNQHLFKVTSDVYDKWFYYLWTAHHLARFIAIAADKATTMGHIKREELAKAEVLIPCEEDYTSFNSIMQPIFELIISNRIESRKLAALRDELLPKLMTGEIDVSDVQL